MNEPVKVNMEIIKATNSNHVHEIRTNYVAPHSSSRTKSCLEPEFEVDQYNSR